MKATQKYIRTSARKLRLVADAVRDLPIDRALSSLRFMGKRAALPLYKTLASAVANAKTHKGLSVDQLTIKTLDVGEGPTHKKWRAVSRGSAHPIMKRTSHINIELEEKGHGPKS